jgi:hypothetical protein
MDEKLNIFAEMMQKELDNNSKKGDWQLFKDVNTIFDELKYHQNKLIIALSNKDTERVKEHSIDCDNHYLFLLNSLNLLNDNTSY